MFTVDVTNNSPHPYRETISWTLIAAGATETVSVADSDKLAANIAQWNSIMGYAAISLGVVSGNDTGTSSDLPTRTVKTSRSGTVTLGGTAQDAAPANTDRVGWEFQNQSAFDLRVSDVGAASATGGYLIAPNQYFFCSSGSVTENAISVYGATTGQRFLLREW